MKRTLILALLVSTNAFAWGDPSQKTHRLTNIYNPEQSYQITHQPNGQTRIENIYEPTESYLVTPDGRGGESIYNIYNPTDSWQLR